jgi:Chaperone for flagella basal body P-ring formation
MELAGLSTRGADFMKRLATITMLMSGMVAAASLGCGAEAVCTEVAVEGKVEATPGALTLADMLGRGTCPRLREAAARVSLGVAPLPGSVRVFDGREVRRLLEKLEGGGLAGAAMSAGKLSSVAVPDRIVVKRRGATKSCAEIARFVAEAAADQDLANAPSRWREDLDCAAARGIPEDTVLELTKTRWSASSERREFALRCARPQDCVPFLVSVHEPGASAGAAAQGFDAFSGTSARLQTGTIGKDRLVEPGQTATLIWDQAGIRVVLPVTCLDAGALGQFVRVRLKSAGRILRAEVTGQGTLRASL